MADFIDPLGIAGAEAFGTETLDAILSLAGIAGAEDFGVSSLVATVHQSGISGVEGFGVSSLVATVYQSGIAETSAFGTFSIAASTSGTASGIATADGVGISAVVSVGTAHGVATATGGGNSVYYYTSDGGEVEVSGDADTFSVIFIDLDIEWQIKTILNIDVSFLWDVGVQEARWYRVQGCCKFPTAAGDGIGAGVAGGCDVMGLETDDTGCTGALGKQQFIQNIVASGLSDLCGKLQDSGLKWEICSIKRFSQPADGRLVDPEICNVLTEVPFCQIPACLDFCIHTDALIKMNMDVIVHTIHVYTGSGGVTTSGAAVTSTDGDSGTSYSFLSEGGEVVVSGEADSYPGTLTTDRIQMEMDISVQTEEIIFNIDPVAPQIPPITNTVVTTCGVCTNMPLILNLSHNLSKAGLLVDFLQRNGLTIPDTLTMHYSNRLRSWVANYHLSGIGDDNLNSLEQWRLSFDWSCANQFAGTDFGGSSYWKFSMLVRRYNATVGTDFDTRMVIVFPPGDFCDGNQSFAFDFSFKVNTMTHFVDNDVVALNEIVLADNIGLFKSRAWSKNPLLRLRLTKSAVIPSSQYQDIYPIFPEQPLPTLQGVT